MKDVAFFGTGNMGFPMALNLLRAGFTVHAAPHRGHREELEQLAAHGAVIHDGRTEAVRGADFIVSIVSDDAAVRDIFMNTEMLESVPEGSLIVEMTSCSPEVVRELEQYYAGRNVRVIDAPVTGARPRAVDGTLTIMGAGDDADLDRADGLLSAMASRIFRLGRLGNGKLIKSMTNLLGAVNLAAVGEFYRFGEAMGLDMGMLAAVAEESAGGSTQLSRNFGKMVSGSFAPTFSLKLMRKDMGIALDCARTAPALSMPLAEAAFGLYNSATDFDEADCSAIACIDSFREKELRS